ncbi:ergothioneine biosynthesis glutamate--cysteine ligase EgtA [Streptomyces sp. NPDC059637]|uniref:ergothioneine biosynthesis glutamate--cysteine ligase EgtA n=1 Tax=Streptomyces sp. NPDC059637 TaxID=3347752 RepID=UPI0036B9DECD
MSVTRPRTDDPPPPAAPTPGTEGVLTEAQAEEYVHGICFKTGPPRRIGTELEWFLHGADDPARPLGPAVLAAAADDLSRLPLAAAFSREPGGQIELSSRPAPSLADLVADTAADLAAVRGLLRDRGLRVHGHGHDPWRPPRRVLDLPRYAAMESYFDRFGPAGRAMMCSTASVQVCLDAGTADGGPTGFAARWRLAHRLGPVLVAAFANSPLREGRPTGWRSTRQAVWSRIDPDRTLAPRPLRDPRGAWARYALDAPVMCVRGGAHRPWTVPAGLTFRRWIADGARGPAGRPPTLDDLRYHLTTLFPPVRPQGHLELRMIDAQPGDDGWIVPVAVVAALFDDPLANSAAARAVRELAEDGPARPAGPTGAAGPGGSTGPGPRDGLWLRAARNGLTDPALRRAAQECFEAAAGALPRLGAPPRIRALVAAFAERHVARGRCPADDLLDAVTGREGRPVPARPAGPAAPAAPPSPTGKESRP